MVSFQRQIYAQQNGLKTGGKKQQRSFETMATNLLFFQPQEKARQPALSSDWTSLSLAVEEEKVWCPALSLVQNLFLRTVADLCVVEQLPCSVATLCAAGVMA